MCGSFAVPSDQMFHLSYLPIKTSFISGSQASSTRLTARPNTYSAIVQRYLESSVPSVNTSSVTSSERAKVRLLRENVIEKIYFSYNSVKFHALILHWF